MADGSVMEIVELQGVKIPLDEAVISPVIIGAIRSGKYEVAEARTIGKIVEPGERILELGAGIGYLSVLAAKEGRAEQIVVVEANPKLIPLIEEVHRLNGVDAIVRNGAAVSQGTGDNLTFYLHRDFWASSLEPVVKQELARGTVEIPAIGLDELIAEFSPTLIVMDIEGGEIDLLTTGKLPGVKKIYLELHHRIIGMEGVRRIFAHMCEQGFAYDPALSHSVVVLFRKVEDA